MGKDPERLESIGRSDFIDDAAESPRIRSIKSGRKNISGGSRKARPLEAQFLSGPDGRLGWRVSLPGSRPLATPAVANGRLFIGGGFGSHEFYAFDVDSGRVCWDIRTRDDGPTAATVAGRYAAFNTESCTVYVVDTETGRVVWESWLGDPLMAQTAIHDSTLFMTYPDQARRHQLSAFDLDTGKPKWRTELIADVISAPIVAEGAVYGTTLDGTVYRVDAQTGDVHWSINHRATSAPWIHRGRVFLSLREEVEEQRGGRTERYSAEGYGTVIADEGIRRSQRAASLRRAEYFKFMESQHRLFQHADAGVGFAASPGSAKLHMARDHLGIGHVSSAWAFQGSRPEVFDDGIFTVLDDTVQRLELTTKKPLWRSRVKAKSKDAAKEFGRMLSPPAVSKTRLYLTSGLGDLFVLDRETGDELWSLNVGSPIISQPAVASENVFFGTADGVLYAFQADDPDTNAWPMWGGGPGHNGE